MHIRSKIKFAAAAFLVGGILGLVAAGGFAAGFGGGGFGGGPGAPMPSDAEMAAFRKDYAIADGAGIICIEPPFAASRRAGYIGMDPTARMAGGSSSGWPIIPNGMIVRWTAAGPTMPAKTPHVEPAFAVVSVLRNVFDSGFAFPKGDRAILWADVSGDFVIEAAATPDTIIPPLEKILSRQLARQIKLQIRTEPTDVYVLSGEFKYKPIDDATYNERFANSPTGGWPRVQETNPHIYIYSTDLGPQTVRPGSPRSERRMLDTSARDMQAVADVVAERINAPFVIESANWPDRFAYMDHGNPIAPGDAAEQANTKLILDHLATQTGMTWKKETRTVKHVVAEEVKPGR